MLLSAIQADPSDTLAYQALADWLEEEGQPERAELLRLDLRLRELGWDDPSRPDAGERLRNLLAAGVLPCVPIFTNKLGIEFALIPAGRFLMGSPEDEGRSEDEAQHEVEITRPFYLGIYPVTQEEWEAVMGSNPSYFSRSGGGKEQVNEISDEELGRFPVEQVSWDDVQQFLKKLNRKIRDRGRTYRLPTEAEWEYGCRGPEGVRTPFHFGASLSPRQANFDGNSPYGSAEKGPYLHRTCAVGSYPPNGWGLRDMHGNVCEWCQDRYGADYYKSSPRQDPPGPSEGSYRVIRGGSWYFHGRSCRAAFRFWSGPGDRSDRLGFRVALNV